MRMCVTKCDRRIGGCRLKEEEEICGQPGGEEEAKCEFDN